MINNVPSVVLAFPPDDETELIRHIPVLLRNRPAWEMAVLQRCLLDGETDEIVANEFGLRGAVVAHLRVKALAEGTALRELTQPPHAAD